MDKNQKVLLVIGVVGAGAAVLALMRGGGGTKTVLLPSLGVATGGAGTSNQTPSPSTPTPTKHPSDVLGGIKRAVAPATPSAVPAGVVPGLPVIVGIVGGGIPWLKDPAPTPTPAPIVGTNPTESLVQAIQPIKRILPAIGKPITPPVVPAKAAEPLPISTEHSDLAPDIAALPGGGKKAPPWKPTLDASFS